MNKTEGATPSSMPKWLLRLGGRERATTSPGTEICHGPQACLSQAPTLDAKMKCSGVMRVVLKCHFNASKDEKVKGM